MSEATSLLDLLKKGQTTLAEAVTNRASLTSLRPVQQIDMQIELNNEICSVYAGDKIQGRLKINQRIKVVAQSITLSLVGYEEVTLS